MGESLRCERHYSQFILSRSETIRCNSLEEYAMCVTVMVFSQNAKRQHDGY